MMDKNEPVELVNQEKNQKSKHPRYSCFENFLKNSIINREINCKEIK